MSDFLQHIPLLLTPLSPIHIGSGHDLDWTSAVLVEQEMILFDALNVELPDAALEELAQAASGNDGADAIIGLQKVFKTYWRHLAAARTGSILLTQAVAAKFTGQSLNMQQIARCITNPADEQPIIPGSSLKGALRTAEVARRDKLKNSNPPAHPRPVHKNDADLADELLGKMDESLFARVALSDMQATRQATRPMQSLAAVVGNEKRRYKEVCGRVKRDGGPPVTAELVPPFLAGGFRGDVRITGQRGIGDTQTIPELAALLRTTHMFHAKLFENFRQILEQEKRSLVPGWLNAMRELLNDADMQQRLQSGRAALVRLGKYCSAESKTVAWRSVNIPQAKQYDQQQVLHPNTIWLADLGAQGKLPLGWALIELADTPCAAVQQFCNQFRKAVPAQPPAPVVASLAPRIIADRSSDNGKRMGALEDGYDQGKANDMLLEAIIRQSRHWPEADRLLLSRLVQEKARRNNKLQMHKWPDLNKMLLPLPE